MDETDISWLGGKKKSKHDKADATAGSGSSTFQYEENGLEKKDIVSIPAEDDTYNSCPNMGIALIFSHKEIKNQKPRLGTEKDRDDMARSLKQYGFDVRVFNDLTFADLNDQLKSAASENHENNDCFVVIVMSHGTEGKIYAKDMAYPVERLWNPFLGNNCQSLINKPKLFFIQACRGENFEKPVTFQQTEFQTMSRYASEPTTFAIPSTADILVMYSTFEKFYSFRNVENGSWFIQSLCYILNEAAQNEAASEEGVDIFKLLTAVNRKVAYEYQSNAKNEVLSNKKEMPNFMSTLTKAFYLRVKLFK